MNGTQGLPGSFTAALLRARMTGQPVAIPNPDGTPSTLVAQPNGTFGTPGGGFVGSGSQLPIPPIPPQVIPQRVASSAPFSAAGVQGLPGSPSGSAVMPPAAAPPQVPWWQSLLAPNSGVDIGLNYGTPVAPVAPRVQPPLNQANPAFTAGIQGLPGTQSGPAVAPPGGFPPPHVPDLVVTAKRYRQAHGLATPDDAATDQLNAESLAATQAGRTYFNPTLAAQYGQPLPAGVSGPRTDVVNALAMPPSTQQPIQLAMPQQTAQNLLQQGVY